MLTTLKSLLRGFSVPSRADLERAYLEGASSRYDLERRERDIDAGRFRDSRG
jgi:hypothetical protein